MVNYTDMKIREIRYLHQGPSNMTGYQAYTHTKDGEIKVLKESIDKRVIEEYIKQHNKMKKGLDK